MKTLTFVIMLTLSGTSAMAFNFSISTVTPTMTFPGDKPDAETVTMDKTTLNN